MRKQEIGFVSSGDPEKDRETARTIEIQHDRMDRGVCPNGCGPMVFEDAHNQNCPRCGFHLWSNVAIEPTGVN